MFLLSSAYLLLANYCLFSPAMNYNFKKKVWSDLCLMYIPLNKLIQKRNYQGKNVSLWWKHFMYLLSIKKWICYKLCSLQMTHKYLIDEIYNFFFTAKKFLVKINDFWLLSCILMWFFEHPDEKWILLAEKSCRKQCHLVYLSFCCIKCLKKKST